MVETVLVIWEGDGKQHRVVDNGTVDGEPSWFDPTMPYAFWKSQCRELPAKGKP